MTSQVKITLAKVILLIPKPFIHATPDLGVFILKVHYMPDTVLGTEDTAMSKIRPGPCPHGAFGLIRERHEWNNHRLMKNCSSGECSKGGLILSWKSGKEGEMLQLRLEGNARFTWGKAFLGQVGSLCKDGDGRKPVQARTWRKTEWGGGRRGGWKRVWDKGECF